MKRLSDEVGKHTPAYMHVSHTAQAQAGCNVCPLRNILNTHTHKKNTHTIARKKNVAVTTSLNLLALQPDGSGSECECFNFLRGGCRLGDGQEMDFSPGPAQMQSLTVSPGQHRLLALQSVAFHGIIEFRKGCRYTTGVF